MKNSRIAAVIATSREKHCENLMDINRLLFFTFPCLLGLGIGLLIRYSNTETQVLCNLQDKLNSDTDEFQTTLFSDEVSVEHC